PERFSRHFGDAPIIEVSGRTYPVEVRYRPLVDQGGVDDEGEAVVRDQTEAILAAVQELCAEGPGDILVFLPGEREIRDTADALKGPSQGIRGFDVLPLFSRLSAAEQHRIFERHSRRRVVLATNVAETSLTVPGITYVIDTGLARISRYSLRTKVQRLPIEPVSQASANQRAGRCGRVEAGICIRLYDEEDFLARPEFTDPEILRTNLASVILQMTSLGLGDVGRFGFVDPPDQRNVKAGVQLLEEIGALSSGRRQRLTGLGRKLARLPVDPRLGRMILEADRRGCLREVLVITAALSGQDPRERPADQREKADEWHRRFNDPTSDFMAWLNLWRHIREQQQALGSSAFRRMCREQHLNFLRIREWQELERQLRQLAREIGLKVGAPADKPDADGIHQALLSGLLSHIGLRMEVPKNTTGRRPLKGEYLGARNAQFAIFPGSGLFRKPPEFVMAAELVETGRLWARQNAAIDPAWAEQLGGHLVKRQYAEPHWSKKRAAVMARERVTLYGVPLVADRLVTMAKIDPALSRELFIRHALVEGDWDTRHRFARD
ncbi:MAG: ATP-dependent RNA helicase HrpA, partial [Myxococcales bacterium]